MITKKVCPSCGGDDILLVDSGEDGSWMCKDCQFVGRPIEKDLLGREGKVVDSDVKKTRRKK